MVDKKAQTSPAIQQAAADLARQIAQPKGQSLMRRLMLPAGIAAGVGGMAALASYLQRPSFDEVFSLAQQAEETPLDRGEAEQAYETLRRFAPHIASDPLVAATFIRRAARYGNLNIEEILRLIESQWRYSQTQPLGSKLLGMAGSVGDLLTNIF